MYTRSDSPIRTPKGHTYARTHTIFIQLLCVFPHFTFSTGRVNIMLVSGCTLAVAGLHDDTPVMICPGWHVDCSFQSKTPLHTSLTVASRFPTPSHRRYSRWCTKTVARQARPLPITEYVHTHIRALICTLRCTLTNARTLSHTHTHARPRAHRTSCMARSYSCQGFHEVPYAPRYERALHRLGHGSGFVLIVQYYYYYSTISTAVVL